MILHRYDLEHGEYKGPLEAQQRPNGEFITDVVGTVTQEPPAVGEKQAARWTGSEWEVVEDHRQTRDKGGVIEEGSGTPYWLPGDTYRTPARYLTELGPLPKGALLEQPEKTQEDIEAEEVTAARMQASSLITSRMRATTLQTAAFSMPELATMAKAHSFDVWKAGQTYEKGYRLEHEGVIYEVVQQVTAQEHQPPSAEGMLAIYRPLSSSGSYGKDGTKEKPFEFIYGMDVHKDEYFTYEDKLWLATNDMLPCTWLPGSVGAWWQEVTE